MTWANADYAYKKKIEIDYTKVQGDETDFPVLISVTDADLKTTGNGGHVSSATGYDIAFYNSAEDTLLKHEIESYTAISGKIVYWVKIPSLSSTATTSLYMYYGDSTPTTVNPSSTDTWDSNFKRVYHLANLEDSTSNNKDLTNAGGSTEAAGKINGGYDFDANEEAYADNYACSNTDSFTLETYVKPDSGKTADCVCLGQFAGRGKFHFNMGIRSISPYYFMFNVGLVNGENFYISDSVAYSTDWTYLVGTVNNKAVELFKNGTSVNTGSMTGTYSSDSGNSLYIAAGTNNVWNCEGKYDEVRISNVCRSDNWIKTTHNTENAPSTFMSFGSEETDGGGTEHTAFPTDSVSLSAATPVFEDRVPTSDSVSVSDGVTLQDGKSISNDVEVTDTITCQDETPISDNAEITDSVEVAQEMVVAPSREDVSVSDSVEVELQIAYSTSDSVSISDSLDLQDMFEVFDSVSISDITPTFIDEVPFADSISISDSMDNIIGAYYYTTDLVTVEDEVGEYLNPLVITSDCATVYLLINWKGESNKIAKNIALFNFWNETDLDTVDKGINTQPLKLNGIFSNSRKLGNNVETIVNDISAIMNTGAEITINTEGACINGIYIIKNFSYSTIKGLPKEYSWDLELELVQNT